ncbi:MAG: hypothetical protein ABI877_10745, partial [Gemmatimonadaceae bacterium]
ERPWEQRLRQVDGPQPGIGVDVLVAGHDGARRGGEQRADSLPTQTQPPTTSSVSTSRALGDLFYNVVRQTPEHARGQS